MVVGRRLSSGLLLAALLAALAGCGSSTSTQPAHRHAPRLKPSVLSTPRQRFVAHLMSDGPFKAIKPGTRISARGVFARSFADPRHGFGLYASLGGEQFPAATVNGGRTWRIDGPVFHVPAADGAAGVGYTGIATRRTYFAYGSSAVDVTTDAGRHWWATYLGEVVLAVVARPDELIAVVQQTPNGTGSLKALTWVYVSTDGGRVWRYDDQLDGYVSVPQHAVINRAPACSADQLHVLSPAAFDGLLGTGVIPIWIVNRSPRACRLAGYPTVQLLSPGRRTLSITSKHGELGPREPSVDIPVVLTPRGGRATFGLSFTDHPGPAPLRDCRTFRFIRIALPGLHTSRTIATDIADHVCGGRPSPWLYVSPIGR